MNTDSLPRDLRIVAWIFLYNGLSSLALMIVCALNNRWELDTGILCILVYLGFMRLSPSWRKFGLFLITLYVLFLPIVTATAYFTQKSGNFAFFGLPIIRISPNVSPLFGCACFMIAVWMWKILTRPDVLALYNGQPARSESFTCAH